MTRAPGNVPELIKKFKRNYEAYKSSNYKEEQLKQEFLNPLFEALGWDTTNKEGNAPQYRDVIFEDSIRDASCIQAPDFCFTLSGNRMFFVEVKKPFVDIQRDKDSSYQLRRYAWSAELPLSILTNFDFFAIYESRGRPRLEDGTSIERVKLLSFQEIADNWEILEGVFPNERSCKDLSTSM